jgi:hypothetical protein
MNLRNRRSGFVVPVVVWIIAGLAATQVVPNWRPSHWFQKGPQTDELRKAQEAAAKAKADAEAAESRYNAALADQKAKALNASQYSQQMIAGVPVALARAPQTPEVVFASSLAKRAASGLSVAIGDLPQEKQQEISFIVEQALSAKQAEVDAAKAALAAKDKELSETKDAKIAVEAKLPVLEQQAKAAETKAIAADAQVVLKTNAVAAYAEKVAAKEQQVGSLGALVHRLFWWFVVLGIGYAVVHFALPSLAQEFPAVRILSSVNKMTKSVFSSHV